MLEKRNNLTLFVSLRAWTECKEGAWSVYPEYPKGVKAKGDFSLFISII